MTELDSFRVRWTNLVVSSWTRSRVVDPLLALDLGRQLRLVLGAARVAELGSEPGESELLSRLRRQEPEEGVVLDADLPEPLCRAVIVQLEADGRLELLELSRPQLDEESVSLVRDLDDLRPSEAVDPEPVAVDQDSGGADAEHDVHVLRVLGVVQADAVHRKLLGIFEVVQLCKERNVSTIKFPDIL